MESEWTDMMTPRTVSAQVEASGLHRATALPAVLPRRGDSSQGLHHSADLTRPAVGSGPRTVAADGRADTVSTVAVSLMASTITVNRGFRWMRSG